MTEQEFHDAMISFSDPDHIPCTAIGGLAKQSAQSTTTAAPKNIATPVPVCAEPNEPIAAPVMAKTQDLAKLEARHEQNKKNADLCWQILGLICIPFITVYGAAGIFGLADNLEAFTQWYSAKAWYIALPLHAAIWATGAGIITATITAITTITDKFKARTASLPQAISAAALRRERSK